MIFENMDRIIFAGDSVTDMGSAQPVGEGLFDNMGHGYPRVIESLVTATYPELSIRFTNSGISGNTSKDLLARYERDVLSLNPQWVSICIGIMMCGGSLILRRLPIRRSTRWNMKKTCAR